jgi:hypothetical protein
MFGLLILVELITIKEKVQKDKQRSTKHTYKTKDLTNLKIVFIV